MSTIEVFEPALCCNTGVCGPDVPQELITFSADVDWLRGQGADVERHNLASEPGTFAGKPVVLDFLQVSGSEGLPLVLVDGAIAMAGRYPTRDELARWAGKAAPGRARPVLRFVGAAGACCDGGGSC
ncbi:MAG: arsenite efflux transporter metallochaperone ArsD [Actinomycetales bacterium]|nr:arsenite efflux transporter metallochaperone ArsD [Actinomycetales bacterium]